MRKLVQRITYASALKLDKHGPASYCDSATGAIKREGIFKHGFREGLWTSYFDNGAVNTIYSYKAGVINGQASGYDSLTGKVRFKGEYKDGKKTGGWEHWYPSGHKMLATIYVDGLKHGATKTYDSLSGKLTAYGDFKRNLKHGEWKFYHKGTDVISAIENYENGEATGMARSFHPSAKLQSEGKYEKGRRTGKWVRWYDADGKRYSTAVYTDGKRNGWGEFYDSVSQMPAMQGQYKNDEWDGVWTCYYLRSGRKQSATAYINGKRDGEAVYYDSATQGVTTRGRWLLGEKIGAWEYYDKKTGALATLSNYKKGKLDGEWVSFDLNGNRSRIATFSAGVRSGKTRYLYLPGGQLWLEADYVNDTKHGGLKTYSPTGHLKRHEVYVRDSFVSGKCFDSTGKQIAFYPMAIEPEYLLDVMNVIANTLAYPREAREKGTEGVVHVAFMVDEDGAVQDAQALNSIGDGCDEEATRVVAAMRGWRPALIDGVPVKAYRVLPVHFILSNAKQ